MRFEKIPEIKIEDKQFEKPIHQKKNQIHNTNKEKTLAETKIESFQKDLDNLEELDSQTLELNLNESKNKIKKELINEMIREILALKDEFKNHIMSSEYLDKLTKEFNGNKNEAKKEQQRRITNIKTVKIGITSSEKIREIRANRQINRLSERIKDHAKKTGKKIGKDTKEKFRKKAEEIRSDFRKRKIKGTYLSDEHALLIAYNSRDYKSTAWHELSHASTRGNYEDQIQGNTKELLNFGIKEIRDKESKYEQYLRKPEEILARKKQLDRDLEILGIKKYGEPLTEEHLEQISRNFKKLSKGSQDLLRIIRGAKNVKKIMNEVAKN